MLYDPSGKRISAVTQGGVVGLFEEKLYAAEQSMKKMLDRTLYGGALLYDADGNPLPEPKIVEPELTEESATDFKWASMTSSIRLNDDRQGVSRIIAP
jgi:hypothetical protein